MNKQLNLIGAASGLGAKYQDTADGPIVLRYTGLAESLSARGLLTEWQALVRNNIQVPPETVLNYIAAWADQLARQTYACAENSKPFAVIGGDHSCAIGTWSGVAKAKQTEGPIGLIWIDAHMDAHTEESSDSGRIHGMPVASLLGLGNERLANISNQNPSLHPQHLCQIGIRSFEAEEAKRLKQLGVQVFFPTAVEREGFDAVFAQAVQIASTNTCGFGISIDLDGIDPRDAPAVGTPVPGGIAATDLLRALNTLPKNPQFLGLEIAEYNPRFDKANLTRNLIEEILFASFGDEDV